MKREPIEVPGPRPLFGLDPWVAQLRLARSPLQRMSELFGRWGAPVSLVAGGGGRVFSGDPTCPGVVFVRGPELLREVELDHAGYHRSALSGQLTPREPVSRRERAILEWGTGLFAVNGEDHRRQRRLISPLLTRARVGERLEGMAEAAAMSLDRWEVGQPFDVHRVMMDLTRDLSAATLLGLELSRDRRLIDAGSTSLKLVLSPAVVMAPWDVPGLPYRRFVNAVGTFNELMHQIIRERRSTGEDRGDLLSRLIFPSEVGEELSDAEIVGHASVLYAASHETTGNALTWTLFLLSQNARWQRAVCEEVRTCSDAPRLVDIDKMRVLDAVVRESLRLLPSAPWTTRIAAKERMLGGYRIPMGTEIVISIFHTHRLTSCYEGPDEFNPGRWEVIDPSVFEFNPFSAGPRSCVGSAFATLQMKVILAMVLSRFRLELARGQRIDPVVNITMAPRRGLQMIPRRDGDYEAGVGGVAGKIRELVVLG